MSVNAIGAVTIGTQIYLFGGYSSSLDNYLDKIYRFNTETQALYTLDLKLPRPASHFGAAALGTKIYIFGGYNGIDGFDTISMIDTEAYTVSELKTKLPFTWRTFGVGVVDTEIYLLGGYTNGWSTDAIVVFRPINSIDLSEGYIRVFARPDKNYFKLLSNTTIGVECVYKGNAENIGEPVEAYLYQNNQWTLI